MFAEGLSGGTELVAHVAHGPAVVNMLGLNVVKDIAPLAAGVAAVEAPEEGHGGVGLTLHQLGIYGIVQFLEYPYKTGRIKKVT